MTIYRVRIIDEMHNTVEYKHFETLRQALDCQALNDEECHNPSTRTERNIERVEFKLTKKSVLRLMNFYACNVNY